MKILVIGAGAVGGYYGVHLAAAGHDVTFVARGENGRAIRDGGFVLERPEGTLTAKALVLPDVDAAQGFGASIVIVAVKTPALTDVAAAIGESLAPDGVAIPLLNGLESEQVLAGAIGRERVVGAIAQVAAERIAPGHVRARSGGGIVLSPLVEEQTERVNEIATEFSRSGFACRVSSDLTRLLWTKLLWNAPFNAVCALTGLTAGRVLAIPELKALVHGAMQELATVARAEGVEIARDVIDRTLANTERSFADAEPSMLQDVRAGRVTEADALQGAVVRTGERHGMATPIHSTLYGLLKGVDSRAPQ